MKRILDHTGATVSVFHYDAMEDRATVVTHGDAQPIVDLNKALKSSHDGYSPSRDLRRVATIHPHTYLNFIHSQGLTWHQWHQLPKHERSKKMRRWLNDIEFRDLKSIDGMM